MNRKIIEVTSSFKCLVSCFSKDGGPQANVKIVLCEGQKNLVKTSMTFNVRSVYFSIKGKSYEWSGNSGYDD